MRRGRTMGRAADNAAHYFAWRSPGLSHCWMSDLHEICNKRAYSGTFLRASWWWIIIIFALGRASPPRNPPHSLSALQLAGELEFMPIHPLKFAFHPFISHLRSRTGKLLRLANKVTPEICVKSNLIREARGEFCSKFKWTCWLHSKCSLTTSKLFRRYLVSMFNNMYNYKVLDLMHSNFTLLVFKLIIFEFLDSWPSFLDYVIWNIHAN